MDIVYEIENMETGRKACVKASSKEEMHRILIDKGFTDIGDFCVGKTPSGDEISAMEIFFIPVRNIPDLTNERWERRS